MALSNSYIELMFIFSNSWASKPKDHTQTEMSPALVKDTQSPIGCASLACKNEAGGRKSIFSMLTYRTSFCFWL